VKAEAQASETPKTDDEASQAEPSTNEDQHETSLDTVAPQVDVKQEAVKDDQQEQPLQRKDSAQDDDQETAASAPESTSVPRENAKDDSNKPQMPGGASPDAPHSEDTDEPITAESAHKSEETTAKPEDSTTNEQKSGTETVESVLLGGASGSAASTTESTIDAPPEQEETAKETSATAGEKQDEPTSEDLKNAAAPDQVQDRGLSDDSEQFLQRLTTHDEPQQTPTMSRRPTQIADNGDLVEPTEVPLPMSPGFNEDGPSDEQKDDSKKAATWQDRWNQWSFVPAVPTTSYFKRAPPKAKPVRLMMYTCTVARH